MKEHAIKCPWAEVSCEYGCGVKLSRRERDDHSEVCPNSPLELQLRGFKKAMERRFTALEQKMRDQEEARLVEATALRKEIADLKRENSELLSRVTAKDEEVKGAMTQHQAHLKEETSGLREDLVALGKKMESSSQVIKSELVDELLPKIEQRVKSEVSAPRSSISAPATPRAPQLETALSSPASLPAATVSTVELSEQVELTALQLSLLRENHTHLCALTEKRIRALMNEVAIQRQAVAKLDKDSGT